MRKDLLKMNKELMEHYIKHSFIKKQLSDKEKGTQQADCFMREGWIQSVQIKRRG